RRSVGAARERAAHGSEPTAYRHARLHAGRAHCRRDREAIALRELRGALETPTRRAQSEDRRRSDDHAAPGGDDPSKPNAARVLGEGRTRSRQGVSTALNERSDRAPLSVALVGIAAALALLYFLRSILVPFFVALLLLALIEGLVRALG